MTTVRYANVYANVHANVEVMSTPYKNLDENLHGKISGRSGRILADQVLSVIPWERVDYLGRQAWSIVGIVAIVLAMGFVFGFLGWFLLPMAFATVISILTSPVVAWIEKRGVSRFAATLGVFLGFLMGLLALIWIVIPPFVAQASELAGEFPSFLDNVGEDVKDFEKRLEATNPAAGEAAAEFGRALNDRALEFADGLSGTLVDMVSFAFSMVLALIVGVILAFLLVKDLPSYTAPVRFWFETSSSPRLVGALRQAGQTIMAFVRGQLILAFIAGAFSTVVLGVIGVPFFLPLGAMVAVGDLIPTIGPILAVVPAAVLALNEGGPGQAVLVVLGLTAVQQIESYVFVPLIVGNAVELSPLTVMISLTVAGGAFGVGGLLVAVPAVAILRDSLRWYLLRPEEIEQHALAVKKQEA